MKICQVLHVSLHNFEKNFGTFQNLTALMWLTLNLIITVKWPKGNEAVMTKI